MTEPNQTPVLSMTRVQSEIIARHAPQRQRAAHRKRTSRGSDSVSELALDHKMTRNLRHRYSPSTSQIRALLFARQTKSRNALMSEVPGTVSFTAGSLADLLIDPKGVTFESTAENNASLWLCARCDSSLQKGKIPRLATANLNVLGSVQSEMKM